MTTRLTPKPLWHILLAAVIALVSVCVSAHAEPSAAASGAIELSLSNSTFSLGEPIVVHYKIINSGTTGIYPGVTDGREQWLERGQGKWFELELKDGSGNIAPATHFLSATYKGAYSGRPLIRAKASYVGSIIVNQWVTPPRPGNYTLSVQATVFYTSGSDPSISPFPMTKAVSFPITITPPDAARLRSQTSAWRSEIASSTDPAKQKAALELLFALPEQDALPEWQDLVADETLNDNARVMAAEEISHIDSLAAADLLAQLCWNPAGQGHKGTPMMVYLSGMWQQGDAVMRKHIENLAASHGERMPFVPLMRLD